jgi:hypothetical protein
MAKGIDPELRAQWLEARRRLAESIERGDQRYAEWLAAEERRRARLRRLTFGLLGR